MNAADRPASPVESPTAVAPPHALERPLYGLRARALLVALPLLAFISYISLYADMVSKTIQFGVLQLAPPAVAVLFALALINRGLGWIVKRELLNRADILIIYAMLLVGVMVSTRGAIEKIIPPLAYLPYYASRENKFNELITQHLPSWAVPFTPSAAVDPKPKIISQYYEGVGQQPIPYEVWIGPLCAWFVLMACVVFVFACLATILRRQWMDNEQLRFPLTILPLAIIRDEVEGQPFFRNRVMWMGFVFAALVFTVNGLQSNFPEWPKFTLEVKLNDFFTERPLNMIDYTVAYISLAGIGFAFFLPTELLFSLWFFFLLTRVQDVLAVQLGGIPTAIGTHNARIWTGYQAAGAYIVLVLAQLRIGWPYFKQVWRTAFGPPDQRPFDDSGELMSYRTAIIGVFVGFLGIVLWLSMAGMHPLLALAHMGIYIFMVALIMSRAVVEAGLLMTETSFLPSHLIRLVYPLPNMGPTNLSMMAMMDIVFARDLRGVLLSPMLDDQKMAGEVGMKQRSLLLPLALAFVVAFVAASYFFLTFSYTKGHLALYGYPNWNAANMYNLTKGHITGATPPPDSTAYGGLAVGIAVTSFLVYMRSNFLWFPLSPLAYAIAPNWAMLVFWFPFFVAWIIKSMVMRFGGIETFRRVAPFMLGMILGEFMMAVFWAVMNMWRNWSNPLFPWP